MARVQGGSLSCISGKVGDKVYYQLNGKTIVRSLPQKSNVVPSEKQMLYRNKFKTAVLFLKPFAAVLKKYNGFNKKGKTPMQKAISLLLKEDLGFDGTVASIAVDRIIIARGTFTSYKITSVSNSEQGIIELSWLYNDKVVNYWQDDIFLSVIVYCPVDHILVEYECVFCLKEKKGVLQLPVDFITKEVHVWSLWEFKGNNGASKEGNRSTSSYLGVFTLK